MALEVNYDYNNNVLQQNLVTNDFENFPIVVVFILTQKNFMKYSVALQM